MKSWTPALICLCVMALAVPALAITPGDDLLIPAAGRSVPWVTDLYVMNPGTTTVSVEVSWLERGQANLSPVSITFNLGPDETKVLKDVVKNSFGFNKRNGAFRITASGGEVVANALIFAVDNQPLCEGTCGSGFEAVPSWAATAAGETTNIIAIVANNDFRTNFFALAGPNGASIDLTMLNPAGTAIDTFSFTLDAYEPYLKNVTQIMNLGTLDDGTLLVKVTAGSAVSAATKVDELSQDPTTLESAVTAGGGGVDGTYQFAIYDSAAFASGGNLVISDGIVVAINGTDTNWDKVDGEGNPECTLIFLWGFELVPTPVEDFANVVDFTDDYTQVGSGKIKWFVTFTMDGNMGFSGTIDAEGSEFTGDEVGCNGSFSDPPDVLPLTLLGGKSN